ncbi:HAMP domain-containing histidine kinase [Cryobacterium lactosi]|uniref:histidine kinase n=1 Tax=Cryobacterium lactosi TaxID=1259202 RepID=A0A4R9BFW9_9MICO|nr:HAMP domain-containing sensor histidine kinase [Cryobacterium lactosi]TFD83507.1 HAMP domain-containing histidine kinase [Cryobacterium lactosi]
MLIVLAGVMSWLVTRRAVQPLGEALRIQRAFVADASHELRTPLAVLDARIQILQRALPENDPSTQLVAELRQDAKSLIQIVNDLLESAEVGGIAPTEDQSADVVAAVDLAVHRMSLIASAKQISVELDAPASAHSYVPPSSITRCTVALVDNALRFSPPGSTVSVQVVATHKSVTVVVRDHGPGIQGIDPAHVFDRFAHSGAAVDGGGDAKTGFGIGLALVREIAVRYGGSVDVVDSSDAGTAISFTVPRVRQRRFLAASESGGCGLVPWRSNCPRPAPSSGRPRRNPTGSCGSSLSSRPPLRSSPSRDPGFHRSGATRRRASCPPHAACPA